MSHNQTRSSSTGFTPHELLYTFPPNLGQFPQAHDAEDHIDQGEGALQKESNEINEISAGGSVASVVHEEAVENSTPFDTYEEMHDSQVQGAATKLAAAHSKLQARHARNVKQREKRKQTQYIPQPGEYVLTRRGLKDPTDKRKLDSYWVGPYKVDRVVGNIIYLQVPSAVENEQVVYKSERFHIDKCRRYIPRDTAEGDEGWGYSTVFAREWSRGTCHYLVQWASGEIGYAEHSEEILENEKAVGIYPEVGIEQAYAQDVADYKKDVLGHTSPILINNFVSIKESGSRVQRKYTSRQLSGKTVVWRVNEDDEHEAGLAWSMSKDSYLIRFTDGTEETWPVEQVLQRMVGQPGTQQFSFE